MKIPSFKRILKTDYPKQFQKLVETLSFSINSAVDSINAALANNISLSDNVLCMIKDITLQVDSSGNPTNTTTIPLSLTSKPLGLSVLSVINQTNPTTYPTSGVHVTWTQSQNGLIINNITGLVVNNTYTIKIVIWG